VKTTPLLKVTRPSEDGYIIVMQLLISDVNNIKRNLNIAVDNSSTVLYLTPGAIRDMNFNPLNFSEPLQVTNFYQDTRQPVLLSFNLDMDSNLLTLTFNETIRVPTLNITQLTLQANTTVNLTDLTTYRTLEFGIPLTTDDTLLQIMLLPADTNYIKTYTDLVTDRSNTFIAITELAIQDMNGNPITSIPTDAAFQVDNFTADTTPPILVSYELDSNI